MSKCFCGADNQSADNAFLCEYYGVLPALVALDDHVALAPSSREAKAAKATVPQCVPKNSLFALSETRSLPQIYETVGIPPQPAGTVRVVIVSDTHERHREMNVPAGDILLHGGDILEGFNILHKPVKVLKDFFAWVNAQPHAVKVVIAGNHDRELTKMKKEAIRAMASPALYLENESALVHPIGLRIFGSPRSTANSRMSPNGAYQGESWWAPMPSPPADAAPLEPSREADASCPTESTSAAAVRTSGAPLALSVQLEGRQPLGPVDVLLTHQSAEFGSPQEVAAQRITKFAMDVAPRRLHCAGHLHASHGLHKMPVPPAIKAHYGLRAETTDDDALAGRVAAVVLPFLPSINATMLVRVRGRDALQRPCVVDIEL